MYLVYFCDILVLYSSHKSTLNILQYLAEINCMLHFEIMQFITYYCQVLTTKSIMKNMILQAVFCLM